MSAPLHSGSDHVFATTHFGGPWSGGVQYPAENESPTGSEGTNGALSVISTSSAYSYGVPIDSIVYTNGVHPKLAGRMGLPAVYPSQAHATPVSVVLSYFNTDPIISASALACSFASFSYSPFFSNSSGPCAVPSRGVPHVSTSIPYG